MYLRSTPRRNKDGSEVRYLQLAHNVWDPQKRRSTVQVVYNFGREDAANREALQRLAASVTRFLDPDAALAATPPPSGCCSRWSPTGRSRRRRSSPPPAGSARTCWSPGWQPRPTTPATG